MRTIPSREVRFWRADCTFPFDLVLHLEDMITQDELASSLRDVGIRQGDTLLVHSSLKAIGPVQGGADGIIDTLIRAVAPDGLIAMPTHTWDVVNARQPVWHETLTPSHVGVLTNCLRQRKEAVRSLHPTHSLAAIGPRAREFCAGHENDNSPCSPTSPYGRLITDGGKVLLLGVGLTRCTLIHCMEEIAGLGEIWSLTPPERRFCIRADGEVIPAMARAHRGYKSENYGRIQAELVAADILRISELGCGQLMILEAAKLAAYLVPRFRKDPHYFW